MNFVDTPQWAQLEANCLKPARNHRVRSDINSVIYAMAQQTVRVTGVVSEMLAHQPATEENRLAQKPIEVARAGALLTLNKMQIVGKHSTVSFVQRTLDLKQK